MDSVFNAKGHLLKSKTGVLRQDLLAGLIGYLTTVYIVVVNGSILGEVGVTHGQGMLITTLACFVCTLLMGVYANLPLIQIPGMGINALFAYSIIKEMELDFNEGLAVVLMASLLFIVVAFTSLGKVLKKAIPDTLKHATTAGLGGLLILIGLEQANLVVRGENTLIALGDFTSPSVVVGVLTLFIAIFLFIKNIPANFLITIIIGTILAYSFGIVDIEGNKHAIQVDNIIFIPSLSAISNLSFWIAVFPLTMILVFENMGLLHGQLFMLKKEELFDKAYKVTSVSSLLCAFIGTSPTVSSAENAAVIASKGKTGISAITASFLFLLTIFLIPWISMIPNTAISSILIIVGVLMMQNIREIQLDDITEALPAILIVLVMPLTYSIADGMAFGFIAYAIGKVAVREIKSLSIAYVIVTLLFVLILIFKMIGF